MGNGVPYPQSVRRFSQLLDGLADGVSDGCALGDSDGDSEGIELGLSEGSDEGYILEDVGMKLEVLV